MPMLWPRAAQNAHHRYAEIDALRGVACLAVVLFHFLSRAPASGWVTGLEQAAVEGVARYGYLGVHLFFVISGFVILLSAGKAGPRAFVASRVARLYPAFWVAAPLTALACWWAQDARFMVSPTTLLGNLGMFAHWLQLAWVDGAYWSLGVELHFYIYVWVILRLGLLHRLEPLLWGWLLVSLINYLRPMYPLELWLNAKWAPLFVAGCVLFRIRTAGLNSARAALLGAAWMLAVLYALYEAADGLAPGYPFNPWLVGSLITLIFAVMTAVALERLTLRSTGLTLWIGALTYPVYLLHQNLGYVLHARLTRLTGHAPLALLLVLGIVLGLAWALHRWVERPLGPRLRRVVGGARNA